MSPMKTKPSLPVAVLLLAPSRASEDSTSQLVPGDINPVPHAFLRVSEVC